MSCLGTDRVCLTSHKLKLGDAFDLWWYKSIFAKNEEPVLIELHQGDLTTAPPCSNNGTIQSWSIQNPKYQSEEVNSSSIVIPATAALTQLIREKNQFYFNLYSANQCLQGPYVTGMHTFVELEYNLVQTPEATSEPGDTRAPLPIFFVILLCSLVLILGVLLLVLIRRKFRTRKSLKESEAAPGSDNETSLTEEQSTLPSIIIVENPKTLSLTPQDARMLGEAFRKELREPSDG